MTFEIKPADRTHFEAIREVELAAFETLRAAGGVSGAPMASAESDLQQFLDDGFLLGAFSEGEGKLAGFAGGVVVDHFLYIGEVDVAPAFQRRGLGRMLVQTLVNEARLSGLSGATLTTDRFAPFNAPFYQSMGFMMLEREACPAFLLEILDRQIEKGLDLERRVAMRKTF